MEMDGGLDVTEMVKENRCMQISESKINTSPSGEPLEGANAVTVETLMAISAPGGPLKAVVGMKSQSNPLEDSPCLRNKAAPARGTSVETHVPDVITCSNPGENISKAELNEKDLKLDDNEESSSDEIEGLIAERNSLTDSEVFRDEDVAKMLSEISSDRLEPAPEGSDMELVEDIVEIGDASEGYDDVTDRVSELEKEVFQNSSENGRNGEEDSSDTVGSGVDGNNVSDGMDENDSTVENMCQGSADPVFLHCNDQGENVRKGGGSAAPGADVTNGTDVDANAAQPPGDDRAEVEEDSCTEFEKMIGICAVVPRPVGQHVSYVCQLAKSVLSWSSKEGGVGKYADLEIGQVMGKPLPKFCGSSASVIATSCYEENILRESQVRSPGDCENSSTECTESNDELTGKPWNFPFGRICNGKFSSSGNATSENASVEAVHDEKPQEDASSETLCNLLDQTALQNNELTTEIENETGMEPVLVHNMTIEGNRIFYNKEENVYKHEGGEIFYNKKGKWSQENQLAVAVRKLNVFCVA